MRLDVDVDVDRCTGHGICESIADDVFEVQDDGKLIIDHVRAASSDPDLLQQAVIQCPTAALRLLD
jgi:ferredoxin